MISPLPDELEQSKEAVQGSEKTSWFQRDPLSCKPLCHPLWRATQPSSLGRAQGVCPGGGWTDPPYSAMAWDTWWVLHAQELEVRTGVCIVFIKELWLGRLLSNTGKVTGCYEKMFYIPSFKNLGRCFYAAILCMTQFSQNAVFSFHDLEYVCCSHLFEDLQWSAELACVKMCDEMLLPLLLIHGLHPLCSLWRGFNKHPSVHSKQILS